MPADEEHHESRRPPAVSMAWWCVVAGALGCGVALVFTLDPRFAPAVVLATIAAVGMAVEFHRAAALRLQSDEARAERHDDLARSLRHQRRRQDEVLAVQTSILERIEQLATAASVSSEVSTAVADLAKTLERTTISNRKLVVQSVQEQATRVVQRNKVTSGDLYRQIEALPSLYAALDLHRGLPPLRSWVVSPDLGVHLVRFILEHRPGLVVETGSGVSTLLMAMAAERVGAGRVVALEHDAEYLASTAALVDEYGMGHRVEIVLAPLVPTSVGDESFDWYDLSATQFDAQIDLLLVDGPPGSTGPLSRYPAVPILADRLADDATVLLDDAKRDDEQAVIERWVSDHGLELVTTLRHEKGTAVLRPSTVAVDQLSRPESNEEPNAAQPPAD